MFNVIIAGHLGKDPETRFTPSGQKVTTFTIATNHRKGKEDVTIWVRVTVWGDRFDKMMTYIKKGTGVIVTGKMNPPSSYTDKEGRNQVSLEVTAEMIEFSPFGRGDRQGDGQQSQQQNSSHSSNEGQFQSQYANQYQNNLQYGAPTSGQGQSFSPADDDDLPF